MDAIDHIDDESHDNTIEFGNQDDAPACLLFSFNREMRIEIDERNSLAAQQEYRLSTEGCLPGGFVTVKWSY